MRYRKTPPNSVASYAPPSQGAFHCDTCEYQKALMCFKPEVIREFEMLGNAPKGSKTVKVDAAACCNYHERL